jgi:hypothetical protein
MPVVYVIGDVAGAKESPSTPSWKCARKSTPLLPEGYRIEQHTAALPDSDRNSP